jgi:hypothetical protein
LSRLEGAIAIHGSVMRIHEGKRKALDAQMRNLEKDLERSHGTIRALEKATQAPREMERWTMSIPSDEDISLKNWQLAKDLRAAATKLRTRALGQLDGEEVTRDMILDLIDAAPRDLKAMLGTIVDQAECDSSERQGSNQGVLDFGLHAVCPLGGRWA